MSTGVSGGDFFKKLLATFKIEAEEHVRAISTGLIELEKTPADKNQVEIVEAVFREAHSLKGAARAVNLREIESLCQSLENVLAALKRREIVPSPQLLDLLHQAVDSLDRLLASAEAGRSADAKPGTSGLRRQLEAISKGGAFTPPAPTAQPGAMPTAPETQPPPPTPDRPPAETVRISAARLDSLLLQAEELLSAKLAAAQRAADLREADAALSLWKKEWGKIQPMVRTLQAALERNGETVGRQNAPAPLNAGTKKLVEFLDWNDAFVSSLTDKLGTVARSAEHDHRALGASVDNLLQDMKQVLMLPFASLLEIFPKLARDLSREQGKEVNLTIHGAELEIDRRILEEIKDPLIHLVRNCIDHGIEQPQERRRNHKSSPGTVTITIVQRNGDKVEICVADDGAGIDSAQVRAKAQGLGLVSPETAQNMSDQEALALIFQSGVSTSPAITDISGRGLGLAIVREKVEKVGGAISVETQPGAGTTFRLLLPLTLATFRGVLVQVGTHRFVLPMSHVEHVMRVRQEEIRTVENRETIAWNGQPVSLVRLADALELSHTDAAPPTGYWPVVILAAAATRIAFRVDEILGEQEVLVKRLGPQLARLRNISGATVLGTGQVVPIVNVFDLMKSAVRSATAPARPAAPTQPAAPRRSILVVEDSITARTLIKNILDGAGYQVKTAVDGVDALAVLRTETFDLVVSDVDMPRMNGLDLTASIRADQKLANLPVVLVTALESPEDRARGIDVGANAYLVKKSFDQSNLLEVVRRLL